MSTRCLNRLSSLIGIAFAACLYLRLPLESATAAASYVVLQDSQQASLVRISRDGKTVTKIAGNAAGLGLAIDHSGNYLVAARSAILRVTPAGSVTRLAAAPAGADWTALALDAQGNIIIGDGKRPVIWRVYADGETVSQAATFNAVTCDAEREIALTVGASGDYFVLVHAVNYSVVGFVRFFRISPSGNVTEIPVTGVRARKPKSLAAERTDSFLFTDHSSDAALVRLTVDGRVTVAADLPMGFRFPHGMALDPASGEIVIASAINGSLVTANVKDLILRPLISRLPWTFPHTVSPEAVIVETPR